MPVLITSKFDEVPIKIERAGLEISFSHYKSMGNFSDAQGHRTLSQNLMPVLVTYKFEKKSDKKQQRKGGDIVFSIISKWVFSVAMETGVLIQSVPKPYATFPPP